MATSYHFLPPQVGVARITIFRQRSEVTIIRVATSLPNYVLDSQNEIDDDGRVHEIGPVHPEAFYPNPGGIWLRIDAWWKWGQYDVLDINRREVVHRAGGLDILFFTGDGDEFSNTNLIFEYDRLVPGFGQDVKQSLNNPASEGAPLPFS